MMITMIIHILYWYFCQFSSPSRLAYGFDYFNFSTHTDFSTILDLGNRDISACDSLVFFSVLSSYRGPKAVKSASMVMEIISSKADPPLLQFPDFLLRNWMLQ